MKYILLAACLIFATHTVPCGGQSPASGQPTGTRPTDPANSLSGKVVETMNAGEYTYVLINVSTNTVWAAAPKFEVKVGDSAVIADAMPMPNYHSKILNRDFDLVYFTGNVVVNGSQPAAGAKAAELPKNHPPITGSTAMPNVNLTGIKKAQGGKTIDEIFAGQTELSGHQVKVRGRVVKYNPMIMGKNWLHIRDGTGGQGSNDLLITTATEVKIGDKVLVTGNVSLNKDFGPGYRYAVMIEDAKVVVE